MDNPARAMKRQGKPSSPFANLPEALRGKFIVIDGIDGCGKSTLSEKLADTLTQDGLSVQLARDPGGTRAGEAIRELVLGVHPWPIGLRCETLLFMGARAELVEEVILPAREAGSCVICDRFVSSTLAYQVAAGMSAAAVWKMAEVAVAKCWPDLTIVIDVDVEQGFSRTGRKLKPGPIPKELRSDGRQHALFDGCHLDAISQRSVNYFRKVRDLFLRLHRTYPTPIRVLDGSKTSEEVFAEALAVLNDVFARK